MPLKRNKTLEKIFRKYNRMYFDNKLRLPDELFFKSNLKANGESVDAYVEECIDGEVRMVVDEDYKRHDAILRLIVLHEMAHIATGIINEEMHNLRWGAEINRLYHAGAYDKLL